jgi:ferric-dicitrate binding protein FerR (iron transport regulator)
LYRRAWFYATAVIIVIVTGSLLFLANHKIRAHIQSPEQPGLAGPVRPGSNKAVLTLGNGSTVILDSSRNGAIASQGNTRIIKLNSGQLAYQSSSRKQNQSDAPSWNTLSTPFGGQYQLTLADGTAVWLNSGSSLRFPSAFTGPERQVELRGEAYFEVARNTSMPFKVKINDMNVTVLGTHFNIMGYEDEAIVKTSLLQGSVKVQQGKQSVLLTRGQQSRLTRDGQLAVDLHADLDEAVAWKNGLFDFEGADIQTVMRQLVRWYNVEVTYQGKIDQHFTGKINREATISKVLQMLELTEKVHFTIDGRKIIVSQ